MRRYISICIISTMIMVFVFSLIHLSSGVLVIVTDGFQAHIELSDTAYNAVVDPDSDGRVLVDGRIHVDHWDHEHESVHIRILANAGGWDVEEPAVITLSEETDHVDFQVVVNVPIETSSSIDGKVSIEGEWSASNGETGGEIESKEADIIIDPYHRISVGSISGPSWENSPGTTFSTSFFVVNSGNVPETIKLLVLEPEVLERRGITVDLEPREFQLTERQDERISISINFHRDAVPGNYSVTIKGVVMEGDLELCPDETTLNDVVGGSIPGGVVKTHKEDSGPSGVIAVYAIAMILFFPIMNFMGWRRRID